MGGKNCGLRTQAIQMQMQMQIQIQIQMQKAYTDTYIQVHAVHRLGSRANVRVYMPRGRWVGCLYGFSITPAPAK